MAASPVVVTKTFTPSTIQPGETSVLTITLTNPNNGADLSDISFTDNYPGGLVNTSTPSPSTDSGGVVTAVADGNSISLTGGFIPSGAGNSVTVTVNVTSNEAGTYVNSTGSVSDSLHVAPDNAASGTLTVAAAPTSTRRRRNKGAALPACPPNISVLVNGNPPNQISYGNCGIYVNPQQVGVNVYRYTKGNVI